MKMENKLFIYSYDYILPLRQTTFATEFVKVNGESGQMV